jgi:hypothetical protein
MRLDLDRPVPGEREAQERAWAAVASAHTPVLPSRRRRLGVRLALAGAAMALATAGLAVTPPGEAVADWLVRAVGAEKPRPPVAPALGLPGPGRLLVETPRGLYTVSRDGSRRSLGVWQDGAFSPRGRFVAAVRGDTLAALDLHGGQRWSLSRPFQLSQPVWAPDGLHVAYRSGGGLRVVGGDGRGDRFLAGPMGPAAPVWLDERTLAWADRAGRVRTADLVTRRAGWSAATGGRPHRLLATPAGVVAVLDRSVRVLREGRSVAVRRAPHGERFTSAAASGVRIALVRYDAAHGLSHVELTGPRLRARETPSLPGRVGEPAFSPEGRWLLLGWRVADEWLFLSVPTAGRVAAVAGVGKRLAPIAPGRWAFPRVLGWAPAA